eukprot:TRINITY_DN205_c1_g1_i22.p4 TRINITY_DN205_c1_g1~~TRINITY_DN205_c1_g1_i22.p4  ORF type:complete len:108 (+),score=17.07 TRINITY_DN205_c1_g1_i22:137-460(+)
MEEQATDAKDDNQQQKPTKIVENSQQEQLPETDQDPTSTEINDTNNSIQQRDESKNDDKQIENNDEQFENNDKQIENGDKQIAAIHSPLRNSVSKSMNACNFTKDGV